VAFFFFFAVLCASRARRCAAQRALGIMGPFWACLAAARAAWLAPPRERRCYSALTGSHAERIFFEAGFVNFGFFFIG
jgi:hypothetical protein